MGPGGPGGPGPGPGGPSGWGPGPGGPPGWGPCGCLASCFYFLCCCGLLRDCCGSCFGGPRGPPGPPF